MPGKKFLITWHGHACFSIKDVDSGFTIMFDPFKPETGRLPKIDLQADIILATHNHFDHANVEAVAKWNSEKLIGFVGDRSIKQIKLRGILTYHDDVGGKQRGQNSVYVIGYNGGIFVHLGDLGHILNEDQVAKVTGFGRIDVLFVPVGGVYTIGPSEAVEVIKQLNPRIAVPMHYFDERLNKTVFSKLAKLSEFLDLWDGPIKKLNENSFEVVIGEIPEVTTVYVLKPPS